MTRLKYLQLAEDIKKEVLGNGIRPGAKIPTEEDLAVRFKLSRNTVRQAVKILVGQGILRRVQGSGTFVAKPAGDEQRATRTVPQKKNIGVIMNHVDKYIFPRVLMGISDCLFENDCLMLLRITLNKAAKEHEILSELLAANVDGLIIEPARSALPNVNKSLYERVRDTIPCVLIHARMPGLDFPYVALDDRGGAELLVDHLIGKGHENIAAICKVDEQTGVERYLGYANGLMTHGLSFDEERVLWFSDEDENGLFGEHNAGRVMRAIAGCSAVLCHNDDLAGEFRAFLEKRGINAGISVTGFDNSDQAQSNQITTIDHPKEILGRTAVDTVLGLIRDTRKILPTVFPAKLIERNSVLEIQR